MGWILIQKNPGGITPGAGGPAGFPAIADLVVRLESDTGVLNTGGTPATSGQNVATWQDQSGHGHNFTASSNYPVLSSTRTINGLPCLDFNGSSSGLFNGSIGFANAPYTIVCVRWRNSPSSGNYEAICGEGSTSGFTALGSAAGLYLYVGIGGVSDSGLINDTIGSWTVAAFNGLGGSAPNTGGTGSILTIGRLNGVPGTGFGYPEVASSFSNTMWIGRGGSGDYAGGSMAAFVLFNRYLSNYEIYQVESYYATKYGSALSGYTARPKYNWETFDGFVCQGVAVPPGAANDPDTGLCSASSFYNSNPAMGDVGWYVIYEGIPSNLGLWVPSTTCWASGPSLGSLVKSPSNPVLVGGSQGTTWDTACNSGARFFQDPASGNVYCYCFGAAGSPQFEAGTNMGYFQITNFGTLGGSPTIVKNNTTLFGLGAGGAWDDTTLYRPMMVYAPAIDAAHPYFLFYNAAGSTSGESIGYRKAAAFNGTFGASTQLISNGGSREADPTIWQPDPTQSYWVNFNLFAGGSQAQVLYSTNLTSWTAPYGLDAKQLWYPQAAGNTFNEYLSRLDVRRDATGKYFTTSDDGGTQGGGPYHIYWHSLIHDP